MLDTGLKIKPLPEHLPKISVFLKNRNVQHSISNNIISIPNVDLPETYVELGMFVQKLKDDGEVRNSG